MKKLTFILGLIVCISSACDSTQQKPEFIDEIASILPGDGDAGRSLVSLCAACHGMKGEISFDGSPFLAGQHESYLIKAMQDYANGFRKHDAMRSRLADLSDKDRRDLAAYYANSAEAWSASAIKRSGQKDPQKIVEDLTRRGKIVPCASCHGKDGNSTNPGAPSLALLEPEYIQIALKGYLSGRREDPFMTNFKLALSAVDIDSLAEYFALFKPRKTGQPIRGDVAAGERASRSCVGCHGVKGNSLVAALPSLAGQDAAYLVIAMQAYKRGTRKNEMMQRAIQGVSEKTIKNIAAYYATQTPAKGSKTKAGIFDPIAEGKQIADVCNGCHGSDGNSEEAGVPSLTRLHPDYLQSAINSYRNGSRTHELMTTLVRYLSDVETEKVALYYATKQPDITRLRGTGDEQEARKIVAQCNICHGTNGSSDKPLVPTLAGQDARYLELAIKAYASGKRKNDDMQNAVKDLKDVDIKNLVSYYAVQTPKKPPQRKLTSPVELAKKCVRCHGEGGLSTDPGVPTIAGQVPAYIESALRAYKSGKRKHSAMYAMAEVLSLSEINAIAQYFAGHTR